MEMVFCSRLSVDPRDEILTEPSHWSSLLSLLKTTCLGLGRELGLRALAAVLKDLGSIPSTHTGWLTHSLQLQSQGNVMPYSVLCGHQAPSQLTDTHAGKLSHT